MAKSLDIETSSVGKMCNRISKYNANGNNIVEQRHKMTPISDIMQSL